MDSEARDIPIVEDDMGEGMKDPIDHDESLEDRLFRDEWKRQERIRKNLIRKSRVLT